MSAQGAGLGLHPPGRGPPAAVQFGQDVHGVVAGVEEDTAPEVGDPVGTAFRDPDQAAAGTDAPEFLRTDRVPDARRQRGQHREGEQGLQRAGRGQPAMRVVCGEHLAAAGVGHQPRQGGDLRETGHPGTRADMGTGAVQQRGVRGRRPRPGGRTGLRPAGDVRRGGHHRQEPRRTEHTGRYGHPE
ncbi:hypothetical protein GCM10010303_39640 [Streptomyces purpurascens]|nr:hypothetical protein GCM10010303_39640 [Streptomyces purpurascens]